MFSPTWTIAPIIDRVLADVDKAVAAKRPGDNEVYLVGHSFGGIILYDILSSIRPKLVCDLFVTVGSQVALFAELGRLLDQKNIAAQLAASASSVVARPTETRRAGSTSLIPPTSSALVPKGFVVVLDFQFETDAMPIVSHGAYFDTPRFFARLHDRVGEAFARGTGP